MQRQVNFFAEHGLAERRGSRAVLADNLLGTLRKRDLPKACNALQDETGLVRRPLRAG
jgi:hypothetical protein